MMKEKDFSICLLYDVYAPLLSEKKRTAFELSYWQDLSLSEIAEHTGTTRQGAGELIRRTCEELEQFESALGVRKLQEGLAELADRIEKEQPETAAKIKALIS